MTIKIVQLWVCIVTFPKSTYFPNKYIKDRIGFGYTFMKEESWFYDRLLVCGLYLTCKSCFYCHLVRSL